LDNALQVMLLQKSPEQLAELWKTMDNGNGMVSLAELDRLVVCVIGWALSPRCAQPLCGRCRRVVVRVIGTALSPVCTMRVCGRGLARRMRGAGGGFVCFVARVLSLRVFCYFLFFTSVGRVLSDSCAELRAFSWLAVTRQSVCPEI
jgi:hypothetical protein